MPNTWPWPAYGSRRRTSQSGQAMAIGAALLIVLTGIAGLVIDGGHDYLVRRQAQTAVDMGALAAGKQIALLNSFLNGAPSSGDLSLSAAHDFVTGNGFQTAYSTRCDSGTSNSFITSWFDSGSPACGSTSGFVTKVTVQVPAVATPGIPIPVHCTGQTQYNCIQVTMQTQVNHFFGAVLGIASAYITVSATVFAQPAGNTYNTPPPHAVYLYQPYDDCTNVAGRQCFDRTKAPGRTQMSCATSTATNNCPTLWVRPGTSPIFEGVDGLKVNPVADQIALQAFGDTVLQDATTICDPYNGASCSAGVATGSKGFGNDSRSNVYCSAVTGSLFGTGCTTTGQAGLGPISTNETTFSQDTWTASVDASGLPVCGALVLNGDTVANSYLAAGSIGPSNALCTPTNQEPYTIQPGKYRYIVINHGAYQFESGVYDITSTAPVNTVAAGGTANGIDHSLENAGDFDLCPTPGPTACPNLTAGIWIGHGSGAFTDATAGTASNCAFQGGGTPGVQGGGGDPTQIGGTAVAFRFEAAAGGFVSTGEVNSITLNSPGLGQYSNLAGIPILFDLENPTGWIHLDADSTTGNASEFTGLIYQTPTATAGGLEFDPSLGSATGNPAITGQVRAYSLTTFGNSGVAVDFTSGYGTSSVPPVTTSGRNESQIIQSDSMLPAVNGVAGMETFQLKYIDEWALDAYGLYVKVNNGSPIFFSQGTWNPVPGVSQPVPPPVNNPGDANPARPNAGAGYASRYTTRTVAGKPDWSISIPNGTATPTLMEVNGVWMWGHESELTGTTPYWSGHKATINFTFPTPPGSTVHVQIFMTDGDFCGDYAIGSYTFNNIGRPNGGLQSGASVSLVQ